MNQHLNQQELEISFLQKRLEACHAEKDFLLIENEKNSQETANLASDLTALTRENQSINNELVQVATDRDRLHSELNECERQIHFLDELCNTKQLEKEQLMNSYRKLASDYEKVDQAHKSVCDELDHTRFLSLLLY